MLLYVPAWVAVATMFSVLALAIAIGDWEARFAAARNILTGGLSMLNLKLYLKPYQDTHISTFRVVVAFAALYGLAMISRRAWTLVLGGIMIASLAIAALRLFVRWDDWAYCRTANVTWICMTFAVIALGCFRSRRPSERPATSPWTEPGENIGDGQARAA
jgi:hypothetical protein